MTILDQLTYTGGGKDMKKDLGDTAQYLKETAKNMASTFKQQYETNIRPRVTGGVTGAGLTGSTFLETLGFKGLAESYKNTAEEKEKNRMGIYGPSPSAGSASNSNSAGNAVIQETQLISSEQEIEANALRKEQLDIQKRTSDDLMALYTITDDYQKEMLKRTKDMVDSLKIIAEKPAGEGGGSLLDIDLPGKGGKAGKIGTLGKLAKGAKGFMAGGGSTIAAGAAMVAAPFAVDAGLGALGYGKNEIDEKQDDANWQRASFLEKLQSAPARGLEKIGSLFGGTIANEARAERIKKETAYLDAKSGVSKTENASQDIEFSEADFAKKDPENYTKFKEFEQKKIEELIAKDPFSKNPEPRNQQMVRRSAESTARKEAINKFKKEIQAAGAGSVKDRLYRKMSSHHLYNLNKHQQHPILVLVKSLEFQNYQQQQQHQFHQHQQQLQHHLILVLVQKLLNNSLWMKQKSLVDQHQMLKTNKQQRWLIENKQLVAQKKQTYLEYLHYQLIELEKYRRREMS